MSDDPNRVYCEDCKFYVPLDVDEANPGESFSGQCRRNAPSALVRVAVGPDADRQPDWPIWPEVQATEDWCGEWRLNERRRKSYEKGLRLAHGNET